MRQEQAQAEKAAHLQPGKLVDTAYLFYSNVDHLRLRTTYQFLGTSIMCYRKPASYRSLDFYGATLYIYAEYFYMHSSYLLACLAEALMLHVEQGIVLSSLEGGTDTDARRGAPELFREQEDS